MRNIVRRIKNMLRGVEERQSRRVRSFDLIKIRRAEDSSSHIVSNVKDLSQGGLKLFVREKFDPGDRVVLSVNFADRNDQISAEAEVRWSREMRSKNGYHVGVAYLGLNDRDRRLLRQVTASSPTT